MGYVSNGIYGYTTGENYDNIILKREHSKKVKSPPRVVSRSGHRFLVRWERVH